MQYIYIYIYIYIWAEIFSQKLFQCQHKLNLKTDHKHNKNYYWGKKGVTTRTQNLLYFFFFFLDLLQEVESSLRTNRDCLASLKCRTPCQNRHDYRLNHPPRKTRPKTTWVKAKSLQVRRPPCNLRSREKEKWKRNSWRKGRNSGQSTL